MMYGYGYQNGMSWWMVVGMVVITALVTAGIVVAALVVARELKPSLQATADDPRAILAARFARGDIDEKTFQRSAELLTSHGPASSS